MIYLTYNQTNLTSITYSSQTYDNVCENTIILYNNSIYDTSARTYEFTLYNHSKMSGITFYVDDTAPFITGNTQPYTSGISQYDFNEFKIYLSTGQTNLNIGLVSLLEYQTYNYLTIKYGTKEYKEIVLIDYGNDINYTKNTITINNKINNIL